jgi:hypothetical protein
VSSAPNRLAGAQAVVPQGSTSVQVRLQAGQECGAVTLTATAPGHVGAKKPLTVTEDPHIVDVTPGAATACTGFRLCVTVTCTPPGTTLALERAGGTIFSLPAPQRKDANPADAYAGPSELCVDVAGLDPGDYTVVVQAGGRTARSGAPIQVTVGGPTVGGTATPPAVQRCLATLVTIAVRATNAVTIEFKGPNVAQSCTRAFQCGEWIETFTAYVAEETTFDVTATSPDGSTATTQVTVTAVAPRNGVDAVLVRNTHQQTWYVWKGIYSPIPAQGRVERVGACAPGDIVTVDFDECEVADVRATSTDDAAKAQNKVAPYWEVGPFRGIPGAQKIGYQF